MKYTGAGSAEPRSAHPGDVGRRVARHRQLLGLSRQDLADRAGMAPGYVEYVETSAEAVDTVTLTRLAAALGTSARELLGGRADAPPGRAPSAAHPVLEELPEEECWARLAPGGIGRVALSTDSGPVVLPVNYRIHDGAVVYRTGVGSTPASAAGNRVAFEVDHIDEALRTGWSILVSGTAVRVDDQVAVEQLTRQGDPDPWAGGERDVWIAIAPSAVTGRTISIPPAAPPEDGPGHSGA
ncbi:pyridoxamine 5'-phosphate oxidase family protein [Streptomyces sp. FH025]|uniref:helix-turn-helix domain-containing protein n=1 Tax=Streptomyces sp. FH025 TaxID=2815937 RepID=UPI001A9FF3FB|nr:pyridoxamine 5'-phosphate oxidase family protein [Streptomyces sp. FH025]MBO1414558.1 pyridoxamine 5'-phosphate oxidase family protein [Streptomyces sp. FH025]